MKVYKTKKNIMLRTIDEFFPKSETYTNPAGGLFIWLTLPEVANTTAIMRERLLPEVKSPLSPVTVFTPSTRKRIMRAITIHVYQKKKLNMAFQKWVRYCIAA